MRIGYERMRKTKLLFYTNEWDKVKEFIVHYNVLKQNGYEVAFATDSLELAKRISIGKLLVVKPGTYNPDIAVTTQSVPEYPDAMSFEKFLEVLDES